MVQIWDGAPARHYTESRYPDLWHGLLGAWPMFEGGGDMLQDWSGHGHHMVPNNSIETKWDTGEWGHEVANDSTTAYWRAAPTDILYKGPVKNELSVFALSRWSTSNSGKQFITQWESVGNRHWILGLPGATANKPRITVYDGANKVATAANTHNDGNWHSMVGVAKEGVLYVYVDFKEDYASGDSYGTIDSAGTSGVAIANYGDGASGGITADIACCAYWNRPLEESEIRLLYVDPYAMFRRKPLIVGKAPAAAGVSIPVVMHSYRRRRAG